MALQNNNRRSAGFWAELINSFRLAWRLLLDGRVSFLAKLIPLAVGLYIILPLDVVPDFVLGLGQLDDLTLLILGVQVFIAVCPRDIVQRHRDAINGVVDGEWTATQHTSDASKDIIDGK